MNEEIKKKWINALKSGEYTQGKRALRNHDGYCCLGVLCELHRLEHSDAEWEVTSYSGPTRYLGEVGGLPTEVQRWAELPYPNPPTSEVGRVGVTWTLAELNDTKEYSFEQLADVIQRDL